jgi:hypothetical protein
LAVAFTGCQRDVASAEPRTVRIANVGEFWSRIKAVQPGDTFLLAPGEYGLIKLNQMQFPDGFVIASADPKQRATLGGLMMFGGGGVTFRNLDMRVNPSNGFAASLGGSKDVRFEGVRFSGKQPGDGNALMIRDSADVDVKNCEAHDLGTGVNHLDSQGVRIENNRFWNLRSDGVRGAGTSDILVQGNRFRDFFPDPKDHPDAIQFWTRGAKKAASNIKVIDNVFVRGGGGPVQGIFIGNEVGLTYRDVLVERNVIIGGMYHGIMVSDGENVVVRNNVVQGYTDMVSWIMLHKTKGSVAEDNIATAYKFEQNEKLRQSSNKQTRQARIGDDAALKARP